ncbi:hypothetical protein [Lewinella sp. W8]|uniref:hypothetical protein n=1 Tax=Lewinella sp. W8 TaxID=2528208 RepID=UPI00106739A7|nr:hypothetical protein [Lewinella sp. W8]MTB52773.1 hypothetical protein [Lewinella sp. W8]
MRRHYTVMLSLFVLLLGGSSCGGPGNEGLNVRLTLEEREQVDRMVTAQMDSLRPLIDSICRVTFDDQVALATDSIVQRQLEEEARLRARIPQTRRQ